MYSWVKIICLIFHAFKQWLEYNQQRVNKLVKHFVKDEYNHFDSKRFFRGYLNNNFEYSIELPISKFYTIIIWINEILTDDYVLGRMTYIPIAYNYTYKSNKAILWDPLIYTILCLHSIWISNMLELEA